VCHNHRHHLFSEGEMRDAAKQASFLMLLLAPIISLLLALFNQIPPAAILLIDIIALNFTVAENLERK
jgi:hypothetical protein